MKKVRLITIITILMASGLCYASGKTDFDEENNVEVRNFNTVRITENLEESNNIDPEHNKKILPYILEEDRFDLLAGGVVIDLREQNDFRDWQGAIDNILSRGFSPTLYVYYSNDTKGTDNICIYENADLIYFSRAAYNYDPIRTIELPGVDMAAQEESKLKEDTNISIDIHSEKSIDNNTAEYGAYCSFFSLEESLNKEFAHDAEISINGIKMVRNDWDVFVLKKPLRLSAGDQVHIVFKHKDLGEIDETLTVPGSMDEMTVEPPMTEGIRNISDKYLISWKDQDSTGYSICAYRADENEELSSFGMYLEENFHMWETWELREKGEKVPYIEFSVKASNRVKLDDFGEWSYIEVTSPSGARHGNYRTEQL